MTIEKHAFDSSNLKYGLFNTETGRLFIGFHGDRIYEYEDISVEEWESLKSASSAGGYFHSNIKGREVEEHTHK